MTSANGMARTIAVLKRMWGPGLAVSINVTAPNVSASAPHAVRNPFVGHRASRMTESHAQDHDGRARPVDGKARERGETEEQED